MIHIDAEFSSLIVPLAEDERAMLEQSILAEGCRDALVVWLEEGILLDGHHRKEICERHGLDYRVAELSFASRDDALLWVIDNQLGRRNLEPIDKVPLVEHKRGIIEAKARERMLAGKGVGNPVSNLTQGIGKTRDKLAAEAGVSMNTYEALKTVLEAGIPELADAVRRHVVGASTAAKLTMLSPLEQYRVVARGEEAMIATRKNLELRIARQRWEKQHSERVAANELASTVILYQGDAFAVLPQLDNFALVVADPPYNVTDKPWDRIGTAEQYLNFTQRWLASVREHLEPEYHLFLFCDADYAAAIENEILMPGGWPLQSRIIWYNRSLPSGRVVANRFIRTWQMVFHCGNHPLNWNPVWTDERFDVQTYAAPNKGMPDGGYHPTPKPQALVEHFIRIGSKPSDAVLDPFAGGGTTGAACLAIGDRRCTLIEQESEFCESIERRLCIEREVPNDRGD